ncbi:sensor domain-containing diguanylate cyclase [Marinomonas algicola]|uniref:sensor domain-containing diguanylate cyclase n=1 Tax=Marinomonas algicola TaxID=2773454 RepID=UPI00174CDA70|nr:diguanylate cyclase [Marinomonas algicola]
MLKTIKTKIITTYSLVIIAFISTLLLTTFLNERNRVLELELVKSAEISTMHAEILSQEFSRYIAMLKMLSDNPLIRQGDKQSINAQLNRLMEVGDGDFINTIYIDQNLILTDSKGNTNKVTHPSFIQGEQWVGKEHNITVPVLSKFEKEPVIIVAVPIWNDQKAWAGTIAVAVPLNVLNEKLSAIKLTKGSYAWLADSNRTVVSHPNKDFIMTAQLSTENSENYPGFGDIVKQTKVQDNGYGHYEDASIDESKIVTFSKVKNLPDWTLFVTTKESEIFHNIYEILYNVLITALILMVMFLLLIIKLSNKITLPLSQLTKEVKTFVNSDHNNVTVIDSKDEIGQLSKAFYDTITTIQTHTAFLEEMVEQRTQEVSEKNDRLKEQNTLLAKMAYQDPLTKLYNRRAFSALVDEEIDNAKKNNLPPASLVVLDIDHFKKINDQFGHEIGDEVLRNLAKELTNDKQNQTIVGRWGGEEFVILIPNSEPDTVLSYMETLRKHISKTEFPYIKHLTCSAGIATMEFNESFKECFQRADQAMYQAKAAGRNRVVWG